MIRCDYRERVADDVDAPADVLVAWLFYEPHQRPQRAPQAVVIETPADAARLATRRGVWAVRLVRYRWTECAPLLPPRSAALNIEVTS